jgi:catechol 2,3-dioxygenase-like lactoylglutathione lyase family enzyme
MTNTTAITTTTDSQATMVTGFNHVAVLTADLDRIVEFYRDVLGGIPSDVPSLPGTRSMLVRFGPTAALAVLEVTDNAHVAGGTTPLVRGHLDHVAFEVSTAIELEDMRRRLVAAGASDGASLDFGAMVTVGFTDPDGMGSEVVWLRDPTLASLRHPDRLDGPIEA